MSKQATEQAEDGLESLLTRLRCGHDSFEKKGMQEDVGHWQTQLNLLTAKCHKRPGLKAVKSLQLVKSDAEWTLQVIYENACHQKNTQIVKRERQAYDYITMLMTMLALPVMTVQMYQLQLDQAAKDG